MHTTHFNIHAIIYTHDNHPDILISCMYGARNAVDNHSQWKYLIDMHHDVDITWDLIGNLNITLHDYQVCSSSASHPHHSRHIRDTVNQLGLLDLGYT